MLFVITTIGCGVIMAIITKINTSKRYRTKTSLRRSMKKLKQFAHRAYRHAAKQAIREDREIDEKPRLTDWDIS